MGKRRWQPLAAGVVLASEEGHERRDNHADDDENADDQHDGLAARELPTLAVTGHKYFLLKLGNQDTQLYHPSLRRQNSECLKFARCVRLSTMLRGVG